MGKIIRLLRLLLIRLGYNPIGDDDGFGSVARRWCADCGGDIVVMRPGSFQCLNCGS